MKAIIPHLCYDFTILTMFSYNSSKIKQGMLREYYNRERYTKGGIGSIITVYHLCNIDLCYPQVV